MGAPLILRYSRSYTLCIEALHTLCCTPGDFRERFAALDPEFLTLRAEDFPEENGVRASYVELKQLLTRLAPKDDEGTIAATVSRSRLATLEQAAQKLWDVHRDFAHFMNDDAS